MGLIHSISNPTYLVFIRAISRLDDLIIYVTIHEGPFRRNYFNAGSERIGTTRQNPVMLSQHSKCMLGKHLAADFWAQGVRCVGASDVIHACHAQPLGRAGRVQYKIPRKPRVHACRVDSLLECKEYGGSQVEGRLTHGLAGVNGTAVGRILEQGDPAMTKKYLVLLQGVHSVADRFTADIQIELRRQVSPKA